MRHNATLPPTLSPAQATAIAALIGGSSVTDAAAQAGVSRATVHRWLADDAKFLAELNAAKLETLQQARNGLRSLTGAALEVMRETLTETFLTPFNKQLRLKVAFQVLKMSGLDVPEQIGSSDWREIEVKRAESDEDLDARRLRSSRLRVEDEEDVGARDDLGAEGGRDLPSAPE